MRTKELQKQTPVMRLLENDLERISKQTTSILSDLKPFDAEHGMKVFYLMAAIGDRFKATYNMCHDEGNTKEDIGDAIATSEFLFDQLKEAIPTELFDLMETLVMTVETIKEKGALS